LHQCPCSGSAGLQARVQAVYNNQGLQPLRYLEMISSNSTDVPIEIYTPERKAEFLLSNAVDTKDHQAAVEEVRKLGLNPSKIFHYKKARKPKRS